MKTIDVVLVTWCNHPARMDYLKRTWRSLENNLTSTKHALRFLCSSESERDPTRPWCGEDLERFCSLNGIRLEYAEGPASLGHGMNAALKLATADLIFLQQDDWELLYPLDLSLGAELLETHPEVDLVRYEYPECLGCKFDGEVAGWRKFDLNAPWPYGDGPHMRRRDFMDKHGWYTEGIGHAAEGDMLHRLGRNNATIVSADKIYFTTFGAVSAVPLAKETRSREVSR